MNPSPAPIDFRGNTQRVPRQIVTSVRKATTRFLGTRAGVVGQVENWEELREAGHNIRLHAINHLDYYLEQMEQRVTEAGGHVHWARTAAEAREIVLSIARQHQVKSVVKAKSMATEEIGLNHAFEAVGIRALETDLGEYIVQMAGTGPSHIIVPAVHLTKEDIADLFSDKLHMDAPADPIRLAEIARQKLRQEFISADMGISGANFLVAETGTLVMVTNEGNGRMCTTLPRVHVAVAGIDKIVPDWESLTVLLKLLARSATGQKITTYTSFITGPRRSEAEHGPREFHLVLLDNGRTAALRDPLTRETLLCIRCGACLNVCPVYNHVGGHAYGWVYSGHQVLVWIGQTTGGVPLEEFAARAFEQWKVGRKGLDDGVVVFVLVKDRQVRIEVGYGLEDKVPDIVAGRIIRETMIPLLRQGRTDGAVSAGVEAIVAHIEGRTLPGEGAGGDRAPLVLSPLEILGSSNTAPCIPPCARAR